MKSRPNQANSATPQSFLQHLGQCLTPQVWKQARQAMPGRRDQPRWDLKPLVLVLLAMTWAAGDSQPERFEIARAFYVVTHANRKRPGKTVQGFQAALSRLPLRPLRALAAGVRQQIQACWADPLEIAGLIPLGCDGGRLNGPRTAELEARLGQAGKNQSAPSLWVTAFVHLATGLLWAWRLGWGKASERLHLIQMLPALPDNALIVADAGYMGYDVVRAISQSGREFLLRLSSKVHLYTESCEIMNTWTEGLVYYWPEAARKQAQPPIPARLIRVGDRRKASSAVWLLTSVLEPERLSRATAGRLYRWRWRNEGLFRTFKQTLKKVTLTSRTVRLIHREAEASLLAMQLQLAQAELALRPAAASTPIAPAVSPRQVLLAIRSELLLGAVLIAGGYRQRLAASQVRPRRQTSPKTRRRWPRRKPHKPPKPPHLHPVPDDLNALLNQHLAAA